MGYKRKIQSSGKFLAILVLLFIVSIHPYQTNPVLTNYSNDETVALKESHSEYKSTLDGFTRGPTVNLLYNTSVRIMWTTDSATQSTVEYGTTPSLGSSTTNTTITTDHKVDLSSLTPNTKYYYKAGYGTDWSSTYEFTTAPSGDEPFSFIVYGDHRPPYGSVAPPELGELIDLMIEHHPRFVISGGDHIQDWTDASWASYAAQTDRINCNACYWVVMGNHDQAQTGNQSFWFEYPHESELLYYGSTNPHTRNFYSFDYGNCHFVILDIYDVYDDQIALDAITRLGANQLAWLEADLAATNAKHRFVIIHEPFYAKGEHVRECIGISADERDYLWQLLANYSVNTVFVSHDHMYYRLQVGTITQITSGGGGAPLVPPEEWDVCAVEVYEAVNHFVKVDVNGDTVSYTTIAINGTIIDTFTTQSVLTGRPIVPAFSHSPTLPDSSDAVNVSATVYLSEPLDSITCWYRKAGNLTYEGAPMSLIGGSGNVYSTNIGLFNDQQRFFYFIEVNDTGGANYRSLLWSFAIDEISPTVTIQNPTAGSTVSGTVRVKGNCADGLGISHVEIYLDGILQMNWSLEVIMRPAIPWMWDLGKVIGAWWDWDTTTATDGEHTVTVTVYDVGGNSASDSVTVTVGLTATLPNTLLLIGGGIVVIVIIIAGSVVLMKRRKRI